MLTIRPAQEHDVPTIYHMLYESAIAQGGEHDLCVTPENLREDGFGAEPKFQCLIAEWDGEPAAVALYFFVYSSWFSRSVLYLEDLYTAPKFRRKGIAAALLSRLARIAVEAGCRQVRCLVLRSNAAALHFYQSMGAQVNADWSPVYLEGEALRRMAERTESA